MAKRLVFLVPGFFGFTSVGAVSYFERLEQVLGGALRRRGVRARIVRCSTQPTASIPRPADELRRQVIWRGGLAADELHFVGHSTGGLDVRMLLTPGVRISDGGSEERIARRTKTAISVATPHHGTPLANHFVTVQGQTLLLVLSALATSGHGRGTTLAAAKAIAMTARLDDWMSDKEGPLDRLAAGLLRRIRFDRRDPVWKYLGEIERDQGAVLQLTPEGVDLFDAAVDDRDGIDYGCVVTAVPKPRVELTAKSLLNPDTIALRALFRLLHGLTARPTRIPSPARRRSGFSTAGSASGRHPAPTTASRRRSANFKAGSSTSHAPITSTWSATTRWPAAGPPTGSRRARPSLPRRSTPRGSRSPPPSPAKADPGRAHADGGRSRQG